MLTTGRTRIDERTVRIQCLFVLLVFFFHHFCSCKSIAVWGSGSHSSVMVHLFHGSCYGKTERRRGGRGGYVGSPAWLFSLSLTFPMWLCICVFDHVNPCLAPTPPQSPCHRLTATHTSVPDRNWQPTLSHTPPPKWHAFFIPPLSSLPQTQIKNEIKTLRRQAGRQAGIDSLQHFIKQ